MPSSPELGLAHILLSTKAAHVSDIAERGSEAVLSGVGFVGLRHRFFAHGPESAEHLRVMESIILGARAAG